MTQAIGPGLMPGGPPAYPNQGNYVGYWDADHGVSPGSGALVSWASREGPLVWSPNGTVTIEASDAILDNQRAIQCAANGYLNLTSAVLNVFSGTVIYAIAFHGYYEIQADVLIELLGASRSAYIYGQGTNGMYCFRDGVGQALLMSPLLTVGAKNIFGAAFDGTAVYVVLPLSYASQAGTSSILGVNQLSVGASPTGGFKTQATIRRFAIWDPSLVGVPLMSQIQTLLKYWTANP